MNFVTKKVSVSIHIISWHTYVWLLIAYLEKAKLMLVISYMHIP